MRRLYRTFLYVVSFGLARGGQFAAPILLANLLAPADYGVLELSQALGSMGSTILAFGTSAAVPLVLLRKIQSASWRGILLHQVGVAAALMLAALVAWQIQASTAIWLGALCTAVMMLQALWSVTCKSYGKAEASLMLDAGFWAVLALAAGAGYIVGLPVTRVATWTCGALMLYLTTLAVWTSYSLADAVPGRKGYLYTSTVKTGLPLMSISLLALLATTAGRLGIGLLSTPEVTAQYGALFRATALPMVAHQIVSVARFRQLFQIDESKFERVVASIIGFVIACVMAFWMFSDLAGLLLGPVFRTTFAQQRSAGLLILTQTVLWAAIAVNDLTNNRAQTAWRVARATALYFVIALPLAWWFLSSRQVTLALFVPVHSVVMGGYYLTQVFAMRSSGIRLWRVWVLAFSAFVILSLFAKIS